MKQYSFLQEAPAWVDTAKKAASQVGKNLMRTTAKNGYTKNIAIGAATGTVAGALSGLKKDANGERHILRNAIGGAAVGTAAGAAATAGAKHIRGKQLAAAQLKRGNTLASRKIVAQANPSTPLIGWNGQK